MKKKEEESPAYLTSATLQRSTVRIKGTSALKFTFPIRATESTVGLKYLFAIFLQG